ncbi:glycoside hydrolase family 97 protein [Gayadomonas joobiniege]|uniref:glycoside hydrolase family 97 protein n=1 Tax=Gayadomonas joobiniege TaxID=1234606 RepID=UPI000360E974|nr:glycoside hydrolase family 97 protein [Gayadomonas joobiniege]
MNILKLPTKRNWLKKPKLKLSALLLSGFISPLSLAAEDLSEKYAFSSPDQNIKIKLAWDQGPSPVYQISYQGKTLVTESIIDLRLDGQQSAEHDLVMIAKKRVDETYHLPWGQFNSAHNEYQSATFNLVDKTSQSVISRLEFRVFNNAVAFRHSFESAPELSGDALYEVTDINLQNDGALYSYRGERDPLKLASLKQANDRALQLPAMFFSPNKTVLAIQEAGREETGLIKLKTKTDKKGLSIISEPLAIEQLPKTTSWRLLQISEQAGELITSQAVLNLSPESRIQDTNWIKTGKSFWDWRVRGQSYADHTYALDNESLLRMIDFAANHNMQYVMIDANWYGPEHNKESNPYTEIDGLHIKDLIKQAKQKGIGFILYLNDKASINHDLDELFKTWAEWGAAGVKYGFMKLDGDAKVKKTLKIVELAAKHKLLINFHDQPIVPSGMRRTWPNWVTREAVHGQTDSRRSFTPTGFIEMAHVNALAGPIDMSNGFFKLDGLVESRDYVRSEVYSTVAGEVARTLIIFSGLVILPDAPEEYLAKPDLFEFLQQMPTSWDESRVLSSDITQHIITARRSGEDWFIGAAINEQGGTLPLKLDFLQAGKNYRVKVYADAEDAHFKTNREAYQIFKIEAKKGDLIDLKMAPGGGQAIWISPNNEGNK